MNLSIFKNQSIINIDCFTTNVMAYEMAKIESAIKFVPQWWKNLPSSIASTWGDHPYVKNGTLKKCDGFLNLYKHGFVIPMWCDLAVDVGAIGSDSFRYQYSDFESSANEHSQAQRGEFCNQKNYQHLKLISPWYINSKKNINWVFMDSVWNDVDLLPYRVLTGVVNYKYVNGTHINIIFKRENKDRQILIPYKTPLVHLIPITEKKVKLNHHLVDEIELQKKVTTKNLGVKFINRLSAVKKQDKCPFLHN